MDHRASFFALLFVIIDGRFFLIQRTLRIFVHRVFGIKAQKDFLERSIRIVVLIVAFLVGKYKLFC